LAATGLALFACACCQCPTLNALLMVRRYMSRLHTFMELTQTPDSYFLGRECDFSRMLIADIRQQFPDAGQCRLWPTTCLP